MRKFFTSFLLAGLGILFLMQPLPANAQISGTGFYDQLDSTANVIDKANDTRNLGNVIANVIRAVLSAIGVILLVLIIYAAFLWMTAAGNPTQVLKAKTILTNAIIGLILALAAFGITTFVVNVFNGATVATSTENLGVTQANSNLSDAPLTFIIGSIISSFFAILGVIFLLLTLYVGFLWMTAAGSPDQVNKAKKLMGQAVIGLVIMLSSYAITRFVINQLDDAGLAEDGNDVEINLFGGGS